MIQYNRELQNIDEPNKAYLLGLLFADGSISVKYGEIKCYLKDTNLIEKLHEEFKFFRTYYKRHYYGIQSGNKKLAIDLYNNGLLPNKSSINKELMNLPFINDLTSHFVRGYFDGDGGCTLTFSNNKTQKRVYIYLNSFNFLNEISKYLLINNIENKISKSPDCYKLTISTSSYLNFYNLIYLDNTIYLDRKKLLFEEILKTNIFKKIKTPICKFCNCEHTVADGYYRYKSIVERRILCNSCKRHFNIALNNSDVINAEDELLETP